MRAILFLVWGASLALANVSMKDTTVNGIASLRFLAGSGAPGDLKIATERGTLRASLEGAADSVLVVFDRNPFAQMSGRTRPLTFTPRVTKTRLVLAKSTAAPILARLGLTGTKDAPGPVRSTPPIPAASPKALDSVPGTAPVAPNPVAPSFASSAAEVATLEPDVVDDDGIDSPNGQDGKDPSESEPPPASEFPARPEKKGLFTIVVDAGHGGKDPGALGKFKDQEIFEKTATLIVARKLRDELKKLPNTKVVMTRDKDVFIELAERTRIANASKGDLFVSLHCNSLPLNSKRREEVKGFMVYLLREAKDENDRAIERRENEAIRFETGERAKKQSLGAVEWMMLEHQLNLYTKESERLAEVVVRNLSRQGPVEKERTGAGQAGFFVLVGALMPSVLIEMGYVSSTADASALTDDTKQRRIAEGIAKSIDEFRKTRR